MCIGWQFFYEGLWKLNTLKTSEPWTSAGYLKNAKGPFRTVFRNMVDDPDDLAKLDYDKVVQSWDDWRARFDQFHPDLTDAQKEKLTKLIDGLKQRLKAQLVDNPDVAGVVREKFKGTLDYKTLGQIELYKEKLARYEAGLKQVQQDFQQDHLEKQWKEIQADRATLVAPVLALTAELHNLPQKVLTLEQVDRGPSPEPPLKLAQTDRFTMWALLVLGLLLMAGLFARPAALGAAVLLTLFYLVVPPWPGVPEAPGPEHSFIVNKNFIEIVACLALAAMPSGRWVGLDALVRRFILRKTTD